MKLIKYIFSGFILLGLFSCVGKPIDEKVSTMYRRSWGRVFFTDKTNIFVMYGKKVEGADAKSFVPLGEAVGVDKNTVYFKTFPQPQVDRSTFQVKEDGTMRDKEHIYIPFLSNGDESKLKILYNVDVETYGSFKGHVSWGYDKDHIYYGYSKVLDVDRVTFTFLSDHFMKDKDYLYTMGFNGLIRKQVDSKRIVVLNDRYLRDDSMVYLFDPAVSNDLMEIPFVSAENIRIPADPYIIIDNKVYNKGRLLNGGAVDASSFIILDDYYSKDATHIFANDTIVASVDLASFEILQDGMARDKKAVYFWGKKLDGVNPQTFRIINSAYFADDQHAYFIESSFNNANFFFIVDGADPATFTWDEKKGVAFASDKKNEYYNGLRVVHEY